MASFSPCDRPLFFDKVQAIEHSVFMFIPTYSSDSRFSY